MDKIRLYVLFFYDVEIIKRVLLFLERVKKNYNSIDIVAIENKSKNSKIIHQLVKSFIDKNIIERLYYFNKNLTNNAFELVLKIEQNIIKKYNYICITDGDLIANNYNFLSEQIKILQDENNIVGVSISLDYRNLPTQTFPECYKWKEIDMKIKENYIEGISGIWFFTLKTNFVLSFLKYIKKRNTVFVDSQIYNFAKINNYKIVKTKYSKAIHLTWYRYQNFNHIYTKFKIRFSKKIWNHRNYSFYVNCLFKEKSYKNFIIIYVLFRLFYIAIDLLYQKLLRKEVA
ncbi:MAG: hypothetical protein N3A01_04365 [Bacteroidales bacterium]|nr:hypothetical protein [Bacteroidales bacterium]